VQPGCYLRLPSSPARVTLLREQHRWDLSHDGTVTSTGGLWHFFKGCEGNTSRTYHTVAPATCGRAGTGVPE